MRRIIVYYCIHRAAAVVIFIIILKLNRSIFVHCCSVMMMMIMYSMNKCEHIFLKSIYFVIDYLLLILCGFLFSCLIWLLLTATPTFTSTHAHNHANSVQKAFNRTCTHRENGKTVIFSGISTLSWSPV